MGSSTKKKYDGSFKAKVVLESIKAEKTLAELAGQYQVHPSQIMKWKKQVMEGLAGIFDGKCERKDAEADELASKLYQEIGRLKVELDWLKKKSLLVR